MGSSILVELGFGDVGFLWREENRRGRRSRRNTLGARREPTTNSTHIWYWTGTEPRPHWWEASALNTRPSS